MIAATTPAINGPDLWLLPIPTNDGHKYHRGAVAIFAAPELTGATRMAATACNRIGAGLVSVVARERSDVYRATLPPDIMVGDDLPAKATVLLGGSGGIASNHMGQLLAGRGCVRVFDADALPDESAFDQLDEDCILTPHCGEFERVFGRVVDGDQMRDAVTTAAARSGGVVVAKGSKTLIAHPDGRLRVNHHASRWLAKAGTGDVLAGMIAGLAAQGMTPFDAASAAVWLHGEAGRRIGPGLIASDIEGALPNILAELIRPQNAS